MDASNLKLHMWGPQDQFDRAEETIRNAGGSICLGAIVYKGSNPMVLQEIEYLVRDWGYTWTKEPVEKSVGVSIQRKPRAWVQWLKSLFTHEQNFGFTREEFDLLLAELEQTTGKTVSGTMDEYGNIQIVVGCTNSARPK